MEVTVPFDAATHTPIYIKQGVYQIQGDLDAAVNAGVEASGQEYSGAWEPVTELMYFDSQHQIAPASEALYCNDCHVPDGRLDFAALGYSPERVTALSGMAEMAEAEAEAEPAELPATGAVSLLPWLLVGSGGLLALGGGLLWKRRR